MPTLIAKYYVAQTGAQGTGALTTPSFTPSNGEVIVIGYETWDTGTSIGAPTDSLGVHQTYTSRIILAPGGFNPWVAKYTAVISGSPGSMTISSGVPSASARYSMVVERWGSAALAATPVTAGANGTTGAAVVSITPTSGTSVISWSGGDSQSLDPATRAYLGSGTDEGTRDDHVGSNGVGYHGYQASTGTGAQNVGLSAPTGMKFGIVAIEILSSGAVQAPAVQPLVVTVPKPAFIGQQTLLRNTAALIVPPAMGSTPIVSARPGPAPAAITLLLRSTLVDPPVLTTVRPSVTTQPAPPPAGAALLLRGSLVDGVLASTTTPGPIVVAYPQPAVLATSVLLRTTLAAQPGQQPTVISAAIPAPAPAAAILLRASFADATAPAVATPGPVVVTSTAQSLSPTALTIRGSLADAPVLTTAPPLVVTALAAVPPAAAIQLRNPQPAAVVVSGPTAAPIVVTRPLPPPAASATTLRSPLQDTPVATPGPAVVTSPAPVRPSQPIIARGSLADFYAGTEPLVITTAAAGPRATALLGRNPQPFIPSVPGPTTAPIVVTARPAQIRNAAVVMRGIGVPAVVVPSAPGPRIRTTSYTDRLVTTDTARPLVTSGRHRPIRTDTRGD